MAMVPSSSQALTGGPTFATQDQFNQVTETQQLLETELKQQGVTLTQVMTVLQNLQASLEQQTGRVTRTRSASCSTPTDGDDNGAEAGSPPSQDSTTTKKKGAK